MCARKTSRPCTLEYVDALGVTCCGGATVGWTAPCCLFFLRGILRVPKEVRKFSLEHWTKRCSVRLSRPPRYFGPPGQKINSTHRQIVLVHSAATHGCDADY